MGPKINKLPWHTLPSPKSSAGVLEGKKVMRNKVLLALPSFIYNSFGEMNQPESELLSDKGKGKWQGSSL